MPGRAFVVAKEGFHHRNGSISTLCQWLNYEKNFLFKLNYINKYLQFSNDFYYLELSYTDPCNFLTKRALVSQPSTVAFAKDANILHYLNFSIHFPTIILAII